MKGCQAFGVTLLVSYLVLATRGEDVRTTKNRENIDQIRQVNKTVVTDVGDVYDCIDVNLQPAFNHPLLKDHKIQMEPSSFPNGLNVKSPFLRVESEAHLSIIECPIGTIPILRNNGNDLIAGHNIDAAFTKFKQQGVAGIKNYDNVYGARATINVYEPKVKKDSKDLSATGVQIDNGPNGLEGIIVGYSVAPNLVGDSFARFHIAWDDGASNKSCYDHTCPGFVQVNHNFALGGRLQHVSVYNGKQYVIKILIFKDTKTNNWWVAYGEANIPIGYWPNSLFTYLRDKGNYTLWGGHVSGPTASSDSPQMGSGHFASEGHGKAAFIKSIQIIDENNKLVTPNENRVVVGTSDITKYTVDGYGIDKEGMHMYYGGPGNFV
ncbi:hypothetical protein ZWY2020_023170 [Hordeum vulgare]|nr:hypothetical protein ZWY2020_023170 [Hordeum vulgare]